MNTQNPTTEIQPDANGVYTIYSSADNTMKVTLNFPVPPAGGFKVLTADPDAGLPAGYTWVKNFGIQNSAGRYLPSVSYRLQGTGLADPKKKWVVFFGQNDIRDLNGDHNNVPGDPPIGYG